MYLRYNLFLFYCLAIGCINFGRGQKLSVNGGLGVKTTLTLGNQNQWLNLGLFGFGTLGYKGVAMESGAAISIAQLLKRHTIPSKGNSYTYEFFGLIGGGHNQNLLGSTVFNSQTTILYSPTEKNNFAGVGFGFVKEILPDSLSIYNNRRGKLILRYNNHSTNIHLAFLNDFKAGAIVYGEGTDYGETGTLVLGLTRVNSLQEMYQMGLGLTLFTPQPNYSRLPRNPENASNGRKNVWYVNPNHPKTFYANLYSFASYQKNTYNLHVKIGVNSEKLGAYTQNKLHDGFGLNPRFPWDTTAKDKAYYELQASLFYNTSNHE